jgi:hypothetical protein
MNSEEPLNAKAALASRAQDSAVSAFELLKALEFAGVQGHKDHSVDAPAWGESRVAP